jgi:hypothetical protein
LVSVEQEPVLSLPKRSYLDIPLTNFLDLLSEQLQIFSFLLQLLIE